MHQVCAWYLWRKQTGGIDGCKPLGGCWEWNLAPLGALNCWAVPPDPRTTYLHNFAALLQASHTFWKSSNFFCSTSTCSRSAPTSSLVRAASFSLIHCCSSFASRNNMNFLQLFSNMPFRFSPSSSRDWYLTEVKRVTKWARNQRRQHRTTTSHLRCDPRHEFVMTMPSNKGPTKDQSTQRWGY